MATFPEKCQNLVAAAYEEFIPAKCPVEMEIIPERQVNFQIKYMLPHTYRIHTISASMAHKWGIFFHFGMCRHLLKLLWYLFF